MKFFLTKLFVAVVAIIHFCDVSLYAQDNNTIVIIGNRKEHTDGVGSSKRGLKVTPSEATRFGATTHMKSQAGLASTQRGRESPSGFIIPRVRGQDARASEIFLDETLLHNPYSGVSFVEDLDLRAFSSFEIYQGLSPYDIPSTNTVGVLRLKSARPKSAGVKLGSDIGEIYGRSVWQSLQDVGKSESGLSVGVQLYHRQHATNGRYSFYSDEGTPYNTADDRTRTRRDNHQSSQQLIPQINLRYGNYEASYFGILDEIERGIPSLGGQMETRAEEKLSDQLHKLRFSHHAKPHFFLLPSQKSFYLVKRIHHKNLSDKTRLILINANEQVLNITSQEAGASLGWDAGWVNLSLHLSHSNIDVAGSANVAMHRLLDSTFLGLRILPFEFLEIESKHSRKQFRDVRARDNGAKDTARMNADGHNALLSLLLGSADLFFHYGRDERPPGLIEEFGDGGTLQANVDIKPEKVTHKEFGLRLLPSQSVVFVASYFEDKSVGKIVFVPSSFANQWRAINLAKTKVQGYEQQLRLSLHEESSSQWLASYCRLLPYDTSEESDRRQIPGIAQHNFASELTTSLFGAKMRFASRYRSKAYRDMSNTIVTPEVWTHDLTFDQRHKFLRGEFLLGAGVYNLLDERSAVVTSTSGEKGKTARTEVNGYPLPGRHWKVFTSVAF